MALFHSGNLTGDGRDIGYIDLATLDICARECEWQKVGPMAVYELVSAFNYARNYVAITSLRITMRMVLGIANRVEPEKNKNGWRTQDVIVGGRERITHDGIERRMRMLIDAQDNLNADEWYYEFQRIHPFIDGNGRVGLVLWNLLRGTLNSPELVPDMFGGEVGGG